MSNSHIPVTYFSGIKTAQSSYTCKEKALSEDQNIYATDLFFFLPFWPDFSYEPCGQPNTRLEKAIIITTWKEAQIDFLLLFKTSESSQVVDMILLDLPISMDGLQTNCIPIW